MYLLSYRDSVEFQKELDLRLIKDYGYFRDDPSDGRNLFPDELPFLDALRAIDRGYRARTVLPGNILDIFKELRGDSASRDYYRDHVAHRNSKSQIRLEVARAMVLSNREFGLLDEICASLLEGIFSEFYPGLRAYCFEISTAAGVYTWDELLKYSPVAAYFLPGRELIALDGTRRELLQGLKLKSGKESVMLEFYSVPGRGLFWAPRGTSRFKRAHLKLVEDLNGAMADYANRLQWMTDYGTAEIVPGLDSSVISELTERLKPLGHFDSKGLKGGVFFGDDPADFIRYIHYRAYCVRCELCRQVVAMEFFEAMRNQGPIDWDGDQIRRSSVFESTVTEILGRAHGQSGCSSRQAVSSRSGASVSIETVRA